VSCAPSGSRAHVGSLRRMSLRCAIARARRTSPSARAARGYAPGAVPVAVISDVGGEAVACLPLVAFARLLGVAPARLGQIALPFGGER